MAKKENNNDSGENDYWFSAYSEEFFKTRQSIPELKYNAYEV